MTMASRYCKPKTGTAQRLMPFGLRQLWLLPEPGNRHLSKGPSQPTQNPPPPTRTQRPKAKSILMLLGSTPRYPPNLSPFLYGAPPTSSNGPLSEYVKAFNQDNELASVKTSVSYSLKGILFPNLVLSFPGRNSLAVRRLFGWVTTDTGVRRQGYLLSTGLRQTAAQNVAF
jgi:hypothetical protein